MAGLTANVAIRCLADMYKQGSPAGETRINYRAVTVLMPSSGNS